MEKEKDQMPNDTSNNQESTEDRCPECGSTEDFNDNCETCQAAWQAEMEHIDATGFGFYV